jgi:hypothetical protein
VTAILANGRVPLWNAAHTRRLLLIRVPLIFMVYSLPMENALPPKSAGRIAGDSGSDASNRRSRRLFYILVAGLILLTLAGLALLGTYFMLSRSPGARAIAGSPLSAVRSGAIAPDMAVLPLAGYADDRVIGAALDAGESETAFATVAYSPLLPDTLRSGHWLLLGSRLQAADPGRAALAYRAALDESALGPGLSELARANISLQAARGLLAVKQDAAARLALTQAENIARYGLSPMPAQRRDLLQQVAAAYRASGDGKTAASILSNLDTASQGPGVKIEAPAQLLPGLHGSVVLPAAVTEAMAGREHAAADLATQWLKSSPDQRKQLAGALGQALRDEDAARTQFYAGASSLALPNRLALLHDKVAWLTLKYRVAELGYGVSLAPEWEGKAADLETQMAGAYTELINGYGQQLDTLSPTDAAVGRVELLRQAVLWSRLGLFPGNSEAMLSQQLLSAVKQLWTRQGNAGLVVVEQQAGGQRYYLLSGSQP